jgi:hypothetical protein
MSGQRVAGGSERSRYRQSKRGGGDRSSPACPARGPRERAEGAVAVFWRAGVSFGRGVPALVVWRDDGLVEDVYPQENQKSPGQYVTISDYFLQLGGLP